tara:strand:+ start:69495 stop:69881 length:387 start_codon:yes stop_codon:yes gene_type:complete
MADAAATAEPEIAPKSMQEIMFTNAKPPGKGPTIALAKLINLTAIPPLFIICPAKIKNGMADNVKLSNEVAILCANVVTDGKNGIALKSVNKAAKPIAYAIGTLNDKKIKKLVTKIRTSTKFIFLSFF